MTKILTVVGARPQFIKAATVSRAFASDNAVQEIIVHTGQHYDEKMSDVFFDELNIPKPDHHLGIGSASHGAQTGRMLEAIENVMVNERPDGLLVYGDTNSTLAGALAASKLHIPVFHVEAGLRSFNRRMPEEINRVLTDHVSDLLFAPTSTAVRNLQNEGLEAHKIKLTGDVMLDAAQYYAKFADQKSQILNELGLSSKTYVLSTIHRAENTDDPKRIQTIFTALAGIAASIPVVLPLHPRTKSKIENLVPQTTLNAITIIDPIGYLDMVQLERHARLIATDSGGVQKEAYFHRVPCVTLRDETEWVELVQVGWNTLVGASDTERIQNAIRKALEAQPEYDQRLYGDGFSAQAIQKEIIRFFQTAPQKVLVDAR
jgi:UDP-GlcNAc3NAcA epimerase